MTLNSKLIMWASCDCTCYPLVFGGNMGRCGTCGVQPYRACDEPADGKAYAL